MTPDKYNFQSAVARDVFEATPQIREDMASEPAAQDSLSYLNELLASATPEEAVTFCAYLLPTREAIWWAHECLVHISDALNPQDRDFLLLAENWVRTGLEDERSRALQAGSEQENKSPGGWLALAVGWTSGSMANSDSPPVPPPPYLTPRAINAAVLSGLARLEYSSRSKVLASFVQIALTVVEQN